MTAIVSEKIRGDVLMYASAITTLRESATAVIVNASPLLAWLEDATDESDMQQRHNALHRQFMTRKHVPDDDPDRFVREAQQYYAFMSTGQEAGR